MHRFQILLNPEQQNALKELARKENRSISELIRNMVDQQLAERKKMELTAAAQALLSDYQNDPELTAFSVLDRDDFHV